MAKKLPTSLDEQETTINIPTNRVSDKVEVYTTDPVALRKMEKLRSSHPEEVTVLKDDEYSTTYVIPSSWIRIRPKRKVTDDRRQTLKEQLAKGRKK